VYFLASKRAPAVFVVHSWVGSSFKDSCSVKYAMLSTAVPQVCAIPACLDCGTNNQDLLADPLYQVGWGAGGGGKSRVCGCGRWVPVEVTEECRLTCCGSLESEEWVIPCV
jgi:hypothetical protein